MKRHLAIVLLAVLAAMHVRQSGGFLEGITRYPFFDASMDWDARVEDLVSRLTLLEMQQQMGRGGAGNHGGPAPAIIRLGIGPYEWDTECLRGDVNAPGVATQYPQALGLAAAFDTDLMFRIAEATGEEVRGKHNEFVKLNFYGFHSGASCFAPVINIMRDPRWGRNQETYGEDTYLTSMYGVAYTKGIQGNHSRYIRANSGCKHYGVHSGPDSVPVNRFGFDAVVSEYDKRMTYYPAFRACVKAGTYNLMCSYNRINGIPACANKELLTDVARGEWGFKGYVVSDQAAIENIISFHKYLNNSVDTVAACVNAGCNLELSNNLLIPVYFSLVDAVRQGKVTEAKVRKSVKPLFYTRMRLGEFDDPANNPYAKLGYNEVLSDAHKNLAVEAAMKSFVLLKNKDGFLPLDKNRIFNKMALVGPFANETRITGDYPPNAPPDVITTLLGSLGNLAHHVNYAQGCHQMEDWCKQYDANAIKNAVQDNNDIIIAALGTGETGEAEGNDRWNMELPYKQKDLLQNILDNSNGAPIVLLLFNAGPVNISFVESDDRVKAIMECFFPAQATGTAVRQVLLNSVEGASPGGRLPFTWPLLESDIPPMVNYSMQGRTYRYSDKEPLYPFGYGLSYTTFHYFNFNLATDSIATGESISGNVTVRNTGAVTGDEVVQVYISWQDPSLPAPRLQLVFFDRITLQASQSQSVPFTVEAEQMALWLGDAWYITPGEMDVYAGGQQPNVTKLVPSNIHHKKFTITGTARKSLGRY